MVNVSLSFPGRNPMPRTVFVNAAHSASITASEECFLVRVVRVNRGLGHAGLALDHVGCCRAEPMGQEDVARSAQDGESLGVQLAAARRRGGHDLVGASHLLGVKF
jgi:hypothetical protein